MKNEKVPEVGNLDWIKIDGRWHHVIKTSDGKKVKTYLDGVLNSVMKLTKR